MNYYTIKEPIWSSRSIGVAEYRLNKDLLVNISYKDTYGNILFPGKFLIKKEIGRTYPVQHIKNGVSLYIIPIKDLEQWKID
jgi:hypothetical protein